MEKRIKRVLSLMLALILVLGVMPAGRISAEESATTVNYRWETSEDGTTLTNITTEGYAANGFTENVGGTVTGRDLVGYFAELEETVILLPTVAWEIEWKATNSTGKNASGSHSKSVTGRILLCSGNNAAASGAQSVYLAEMYALCQYGTPLYSKYNQLGNKLTSDQEGYSGVHTYTIKNVLTSDGNKIYLYVNGKEALELNKVYSSGTEKADADASGLVNATYCFNYIGDSEAWTLSSPEFHYLEIRNAHVHSGEWVAGATGLTKTCSCGHEESVDYYAYRWQVNDDVFASVTADGVYRENAIPTVNGTISDGVFSDVYAKLTTPVVLNHETPWVIEWTSSGSWSGMLLCGGSRADGVNTIYRSGSLGLGIGVYSNSAYQHYGVDNSIISDYMNSEHTFRLENRFEGDSNMVWLFIDGEPIAEMSEYFKNSSNSTADPPLGAEWISNADLLYNYIGVSGSHALDGIALKYLEVWPYGQPDAEARIGGEYYATVEAALAAAETDDVVLLLKDATVETDLDLSYTGALDLNGHTLTAKNVYIGSNTQIIDAVGNGQLIASENVAFTGQGAYLPIYNGTGYTFEEVRCENVMVTGDPTEGSTKLYFVPELSEDVHEHIISEGKVELKVKINYTLDGEAKTLTCAYTEELLKAFYDGYADESYAYAFCLGLTGTTDLSALSFEVYFESETGAKVSVCIADCFAE